MAQQCMDEDVLGTVETRDAVKSPECIQTNVASALHTSKKHEGKSTSEAVTSTKATTLSTKEHLPKVHVDIASKSHTNNQKEKQTTPKQSFLNVIGVSVMSLTSRLHFHRGSDATRSQKVYFSPDVQVRESSSSVQLTTDTSTTDDTIVPSTTTTTTTATQKVQPVPEPVPEPVPTVPQPPQRARRRITMPGAATAEATLNAPALRRAHRRPSLRVRISREIVQGGTTGPSRPSLSERFLARFRRKVKVKIEPLEGEGLSTTVLYAPEQVGERISAQPFAETKLISGRPSVEDCENLVFNDSPFEIRVAGMLVQAFDVSPFGKGDNELLMYSVQTDPETTGDTNQSLPFIHFDYKRDGHAANTAPNTYVPIPASKSYVLSSPGGHAHQIAEAERDVDERPETVAKPDKTSQTAHGDKVEKDDTKPVAKKTRPTSDFLRCKSSVNVQFKILELDEVSDVVKQSISGIDELGGYLSSYSSAAPFLGLLSPALSMAGAISKRALDSYAKPDRVISIDMDFLLADRERFYKSQDRGEADIRAGRFARLPSGEYLRYGYYFFLSEPFEGKLYASVRTPKNVQLMVKLDESDKSPPKDADGHPIKGRKFFPLTEISYLVVRVCEPTCSATRNRKPIQMAHARKLEAILKESDPSKDNGTDIKNAVYELAQDLGVLPDSGGKKKSE